MDKHEHDLSDLFGEVKSVRDDCRKLKAGQGEIKTRLTELEKKLTRTVCAAALAGAFIGALVGGLL